jgi:hypothetical protein
VLAERSIHDGVGVLIAAAAVVLVSTRRITEPALIAAANAAGKPGG